MTAFAIRAERAVVNIFVASLTLFCSPSEFQRCMALLALYRGVLSFQSKTGILVLEFQIQTQRLPRFGGMAIAARNFDIAVRMVYCGNLRFGS